MLARSQLITAVLSGFLALLFPDQTLALPKGAQQLGSQDLYQTFKDGKVITCGRILSEWRSGIMVGFDKALFLSRADKIKDLKKKSRTAAEPKLSKLLSQLKKQRSLQRIENPICVEGSPTSTPTPTPTPGGGCVNFDAFGNVTAAGITAFQIPSNLAANINTGTTVWQANCTGCHSANLNRTFVAVKQAFQAEPQMSFALSISDADLAQIIAYLNRNNC